jgi:hypothetical protein
MVSTEIAGILLIATTLMQIIFWIISMHNKLRERLVGNLHLGFTDIA